MDANKLIRKLKFRLNSTLTKDFVLIYKLSLVAMLLVGGCFVKFSLSHENSKIKEEIIFAAAQIEKSITYNVDYLKYQLFYSAKQIKEISDPDNSKKEIGKILSSFVGNINNQVDIAITWNAFSWIDSKNMLVVDGTGGLLQKPIDLSDRDYIKNTSKSPNLVVFGKPVIGALSGRFIIPVGMGVFSNQNTYLGTLVFGLDIERILAKLEKVIGNETYSFAVIRDDKIAFSSENIESANLEFAQQAASKFNSEIAGVSSTGEFIKSQKIFSKDEGFVYLQNVKNSPLKILLFYNEKKAHQQLSGVVLKHSFLVLFLLISVSILFQIIYKKIVKPVQNLSKLALKISKKEFEFNIEKPERKEFASLFSTLNLVKNILRREEELLHELEMSNKQLLKANEAKADLLSKSSHDIKNYVFGIGGLSNLILESDKKSKFLKSEDKKMLETISHQSEELLHFVEDLLDINQQETGEFTLDKMQICDVSEIIGRILLLNKGLAIRHNVTLEAKIEEDLPKMQCDLRRMKQILVNLLTNAIKYSVEKTVILISVSYSKKNQKIHITIKDSGIGMTADEIKLLLSGQGKDIDKSQLSNLDSHGIGMDITLKLVKLHHGTISVNSKKGVGTTIELVFDAYEGDLKEVKKESEVQNNKKSASILLVEDNPVNIKITSKILHNAGYEVSHVENGLEALKILDEEKFDLILMDGEMPVMNGYQAIKEIRLGSSFKKFKNHQTIPIIALMASSDKETVQKAFDSGANFNLEKTINKKDFLAAVARALD
jgi:signal transduction histidine kinase/CheY-like chemotaxis protein